MPRSNWKGNINFGLVNIPIVLFNSENKAKKMSFHQIDIRDHAPIKYARVNAETGAEVPWEDVGKAYEYSKNNLLVVNKGELERVAGDNVRTISIEAFVDKNSIDMIDIDKTYYILPDKKGDKGYVILREALKETNKIGIAKVIMSTKEYLSALAYYKNTLVLYLLRYPEEIRSLTEFDIPSADLKETKVTTKEVEVAKQLIKAMAAKWKPNEYKDEYREAVEKWAQEKIKEKPHKVKMAPRGKGVKPKDSSDFINLLKQSLKTSGIPKRSSEAHHRAFNKHLH